MRTWCAREFSELGLQFTPVQANMGYGVAKETLRAMHFQKAPALEAFALCKHVVLFNAELDSLVGPILELSKRRCPFI